MKNAIIVDDEKLSCDLIQYLVKKLNLPITVIGEAAAGDQAVMLIAERKPDFVFLDIEIPVFNGIEVMRQVKDTDAEEPKFIVITAFDYFEYAQSALRLGAKDILLKPIEPPHFMEMMERVLGYQLTAHPLLNEILEYLADNIEMNIRLSDCADQFHVTCSHISRLFNKHVGVHFTTYVNELKIRKALELLNETDLPIKEVAYKVGYKNLNYFYKNFKAITGVTPKTLK